jgi:hypothetical protein
MSLLTRGPSLVGGGALWGRRMGIISSGQFCLAPLTAQRLLAIVALADHVAARTQIRDRPLHNCDCGCGKSTLRVSHSMVYERLWQVRRAWIGDQMLESIANAE